MKTVVPDPPELLASCLTPGSLGTPSQNESILPDLERTIDIARPNDEAFFDLRSGISAQDALIHASELLKCAAASAYETADNLTGEQRALAFSAYHLIGMAKTLIDSALNQLGK